ncbi:hypothetical protein A9R05_05455 [Burkholderia sp. KK1]|nr:hypothetical protein A9R05_05455 [Burkholderia sp. KK1]
MASYPRQSDSAQAQFEELLKRSDFFHSALTSQRNAIADLMATFMALLVESSVVDPAALVAKLKLLESDTGHPSDDSTRRYLISQIREKIQIA